MSNPITSVQIYRDSVYIFRRKSTRRYANSHWRINLEILLKAVTLPDLCSDGWNKYLDYNLPKRIIRTWKVYCVRDGLAGRIPNSVSYFTNKREARAHCADTVRNLRDDGLKVIGCFDTGYAYENSVIDVDVISFDTKAERDQFISDNEE